MVKLIKRLCLWIQIYALDITIKGQTEALECVSCSMIKTRIEHARHIARGERSRLRCEYHATFPVGQVRVYTTA